MTLTGWVVLAASPSPTPDPTPAFGPTNNPVPGSGDSVSAGLDAFLVIVALAVALVLIVWAMNRSLRRARRNLGGSELPHQDSDTHPVVGRDGDSTHR